MSETVKERWMRQPHFTCPRCDATSWSPNDIRELYCGRCHLFFAPTDMREGAHEAYRRSPPSHLPRMRPADEPKRSSAPSDDDTPSLTFPTPSYDPPAAPDFDPGGGSSGGGGASGDY